MKKKWRTPSLRRQCVTSAMRLSGVRNLTVGLVSGSLQYTQRNGQPREASSGTNVRGRCLAKVIT